MDKRAHYSIFRPSLKKTVGCHKKIKGLLVQRPLFFQSTLCLLLVKGLWANHDTSPSFSSITYTMETKPLSCLLHREPPGKSHHDHFHAHKQL